MNRDHLPNHLRRIILVESGHRCAIPTCRATPIEIAHIVPWAQTREHSPDNLISLCPNCHARYHRGEIDRESIRTYKRNLGILNNRYSELERRVFENAYLSGQRFWLLGPGADILCAYAVRDGLLKYMPDVKGIEIRVESGGRFFGQFPTVFGYWITDEGMEFIKKYCSGQSLDE